MDGTIALKVFLVRLSLARLSESSFAVLPLAVLEFRGRRTVARPGRAPTAQIVLVLVPQYATRRYR